VAWKPIVWSQSDHYPQWHSYPTREGQLPAEGSQITLIEHPGRTFIVTAAEAGAGMVWLRPLRDLESF
jgi:hypothetical protein